MNTWKKHIRAMLKLCAMYRRQECSRLLLWANVQFGNCADSSTDNLHPAKNHMLRLLCNSLQTDTHILNMYSPRSNCSVVKYIFYLIYFTLKHFQCFVLADNHMTALEIV